jgi:O-acetyl-ADP-ribose deacetylase (regulator of RNase III)
MVGSYNIINKSIIDLDFEKYPAIVLPHIVNNIGKFGAGVSGVIAKKWPNVLVDYNLFWRQSDLGDTIITSAQSENYHNVLFVLSMIAQEGVRTQKNYCPLNYGALKSCMENILNVFNWNDFVICCPKFGAGLAGGNWDIIEKMIKNIWVNNGVDVIFYDWKLVKEN